MFGSVTRELITLSGFLGGVSLTATVGRSVAVGETAPRSHLRLYSGVKNLTRVLSAFF